MLKLPLLSAITHTKRDLNIGLSTSFTGKASTWFQCSTAHRHHYGVVLGFATLCSWSYQTRSVGTSVAIKKLQRQHSFSPGSRSCEIDD